MPGGGLYVLVAYGSQNMMLSGNPDYTYFYTVMKKHSHFSFESVTIPFEGGSSDLVFDEPVQIRAKIQRVAELLSDLYFTFTLPDIYSKFIDVVGANQCEFQWVRYIGAQIIQDVSFFVGGTLVQQFDSDYIISTALVDQDETQYNKWQELVGDVPELYDPANGKYSGGIGNTPNRTHGFYPHVLQNKDGNGVPLAQQNNFPSIPSRDITLPLGLWFSQNYGLALPHIGLQQHECIIQITLRPLQDLYTVVDSSGNRVRPGYMLDKTVSNLNTGNVQYIPDASDRMYIRNYLTDFGYTTTTNNRLPINPRLQGTYVYLTDDERRTFAVTPLQYLVRQVTRYDFSNVTSRQFVELFTHNPVPRIIIVPRRSDAIQYRNDWTNYTNWWKYPMAPFVPSNSTSITYGTSGVNSQGIQQDIIRDIRIVCDGNEIQEVKPLQYFRELTSWKNTTGVFPPGLAVYSFALDSSRWTKPSGTLNTSRVRKFQVDIGVNDLPANTNYMFEYVIYVETLNYFVVESGMGGMKYAT